VDRWPALVAQQSTSLLGDPPEELTDLPPAANTTVLAADGELITSFYRGYSNQYTLTAPSSYRSRIYRQEGGPYTVGNAGTYRPTLDLTTALYQSSNTYFVALEDALGSVEEPVRMAEDMGL